MNLVEGISFRLFPPNGQHQHAQPINVDIALYTSWQRLFDEHLVTAPECYIYIYIYMAPTWLVVANVLINGFAADIY